MATPCKYFSMGSCIYGDKCSYSHDPSLIAAFKSLQQGDAIQGGNWKMQPQGPRPRPFTHGIGIPSGLSGPRGGIGKDFRGQVQPMMQMRNMSHGDSGMVGQLAGHASQAHLMSTAQPIHSQHHKHHQPQHIQHHSHHGHSKRPPDLSFFVSEDIKAELLARQVASEAASIDATLQQVDNYHSLVLLDTHPTESSLFQYPSLVYKAVSSTGAYTALRRLANARLTDKKAMVCVDLWKKVSHPCVIPVIEVFTTRHFHDHSVVFVCDYYPRCETVMSHYLLGEPLDESLLWTIVIQITAALRTIHSAGLACRVIDPSKILVQDGTGGTRVLISGTCVMDILTYNPAQTPSQCQTATALYQQEDLQAFGRLVIALACGSPFVHSNLPHSLRFITSKYSEDIINLIRYLMAPTPTRMKTVNDLMPFIGARFFTEIEGRIRYSTRLETDLSRELHNGRLLRLAYKLMFVADRSTSQDPRLAATGDLYLLSLFKDYAFHQVNESREPVVDIAHLVQCLNKLEIGSPERVYLVSADEKNVIMVTYADLHRCLSTAFSDIMRQSALTSSS